MQDIATWASQHHENLDGEGYPFRHKGDELPLESRILAVADVFTALAEDRPYRPGMEDGKVLEIMHEMVEDGKLDRDVVDLLIANIEDVQGVRREAQSTENLQLTDFWDQTRQDVNDGGSTPA
jgi:HD-GYP domain-containing protein (c-di-GMP phosphodiesterase class II)